MAARRIAGFAKKGALALPTLLAMLPWALVLATARNAEAVAGIWYVYPGLNDSGLFDYGWHFDESNTDYGARDWNFPNDSGATAAFAAQISGQDIYFPIRFKLAHYGTYGEKVTAQFFDGASVWDIQNSELHYLHLSSSSRPANPTYTDWGSEEGTWFIAGVGTLGTGDTQFPHLHESANLGPNEPGIDVNRVSLTNDTCWADSDGFRCPSTYRKHQSCSSWSGTAGISGNIAQYVCEEWSKENRDPKTPTFQFNW